MDFDRPELLQDLPLPVRVIHDCAYRVVALLCAINNTIPGITVGRKITNAQGRAMDCELPSRWFMSKRDHHTLCLVSTAVGQVRRFGLAW